MKNVVICLSLAEKHFQGLDKVKEMIPLKDCKVTLLHVWNNQAYEYPGGPIVPFYPDEKQSVEIEAEMRKVLDKQYDRFPGLARENFNASVLAAPNSKEEAVRYLEDNKADLVICLTPEKRGIKSFFHSSFTNYMSSHAPCDVMALRV